MLKYLTDLQNTQVTKVVIGLLKDRLLLILLQTNSLVETLLFSHESSLESPFLVSQNLQNYFSSSTLYVCIEIIDNPEKHMLHYMNRKNMDNYKKLYFFIQDDVKFCN